MSPAAPDPRFREALMAKRKGDDAKAREVLEAMIADDPDCQDALEVLGMMLSEAGELDRAIDLTSHLADLDPSSIMAHANLSRFYMLKGDKETAEDWQAKARVLGWKEEIGRKAAQGGDTSGMDQGVNPDAVERQEQAVEADPDSVVSRLALAISYRKLGMPAKSVSHLRHALKLDPEMSALYLELGKSLEEANMKVDAIQVYKDGIPRADARGDLMPRNQMASRLAQLEKAEA